MDLGGWQMKGQWLTNVVPSLEDITRRLNMIFSRELDPNGYILREIGSRTVFVMLYTFCVQGSNWLRPAIVTCMTDAQAAILDEKGRRAWLAHSLNRKKKEKDIPGRWYKENTRESIRDETMRTLVHLGAIIENTELPTTSPAPRYTLQLEFAQLFNPEMQEEELQNAVAEWQNINLSAAARARIAISKGMTTSASDGVLVRLPNGETRMLSTGPSSDIAKAVVEEMAPRYLKEPAVLLISESAQKIIVNDEKICAAIGFDINVSKVLPDIIMVDLGQSDPLIVFVECVATDGPINDRRKLELILIAQEAGYREEDITFVTAFRDRTDSASRKLVPSIAWNTIIWYATEPDSIVYMSEGRGGSSVTLGEFT